LKKIEEASLLQKFEEQYSSYNAKSAGTPFDQKVDKRIEELKKPNVTAAEEKFMMTQELIRVNNPNYNVK